MEADLKMKSFIQNNRNDVEVATIRLMPFTTLTKSEWAKIGELMNSKVTNALWTRFLNFGLASLLDNERIELDLVGQEWIGIHWQ